MSDGPTRTPPRRRIPPGSGVAAGLAIGIGLGVAFDMLGVGLALGIALGAAADGARAAGGRRRADEDAGSVARALLWLLAGLGGVVLLGIAVAPELLADPGTAVEIALVTVAAGAPGLLVLLVIARRRRAAEDDRHGQGR